MLREPTRVADNSNSCIDHVYAKVANKAETEVSVAVLQANVTDHAMIHVRVCVCVRVGGMRGGTEPSADSEPVAYRIDYAALSTLLDNTDWSDVYCQLNPSTAFDIFYAILQNLILQSKKIVNKTTVSEKKLKPWMTDFICMKVRIKNKLFNKVKKHPNNETLLKYYKTFCNKLRTKIREQKDYYYSKLFENCNRDSKATWKVLNEVTGQNVRKPTEITLAINGSLSSKPEAVSNELNNYFLSIVDELNINSRTPINFDLLKYKTCFKTVTSINSMFVYPVSKEDLVHVIKTLKNGTSPGIDSISSLLVKNIHTNILDVLQYLINSSFEKGIFPDKLKEAVVIPLYKSGSKHECNNFRPISLLSTFAKIYEKLMKKRLIHFLEQNNFFSSKQFGFREGLNTENALKHFMETVYTGLNSNKKVSGMFLDIKKAFDTVDHTILLQKMLNCGIRGNVNNWFQSYLTKRKQCTKVNNVLSKMGYVKYGVPQGSVLGAILFLIYINDLCKGSFKGKLTSFADDTAFCYVHDSWNDIKQAMNEDLMALQWWFTKNHMLLSPEKTKFLNFSLRTEFKFTNDILYKCALCLSRPTYCSTKCATVGQADNIKYLGIVLDQELNWKEHVHKLKQKLNNVLRYFYYLKNMCNENVLRTLYFSLFHSRIDYGLFCWGGTYATNINQIFLQQKKCIRMIAKKSKLEPSQPLFFRLKILPLKHMFVCNILKQYFIISKNVENNAISYKNKLRRQEHLQVPKPNLTFFTKCFCFLGPKIMNIIPSEFKTCTNVKLFMSKVRFWLGSIQDINNLICVQR